MTSAAQKYDSGMKEALHRKDARAYLILYEGDKRGHHNCHTMPKHSRQLVAQALPCTPSTIVRQLPHMQQSSGAMLYLFCTAY